jgi:cysteinyl-tRNA synthetase
MALRLFNTLTRQKEEFYTVHPGEVRMYTCGPTIYDFAHIGNFRAYIFGDILRRYLEYKGYKVTYVMNITDVDDKTIKGSKEEGIHLSEFTKRYREAFFDDIRALNIKPATIYPEATAHIKDMEALVKTLIDKGYAYQNEGST